MSKKGSEAYERYKAKLRDRYWNDPEYRERKLEQMHRYRGTAAFMLSQRRYETNKRRSA